MSEKTVLTLKEKVETVLVILLATITVVAFFSGTYWLEYMPFEACTFTWLIYIMWRLTRWMKRKFIIASLLVWAIFFAPFIAMPISALLIDSGRYALQKIFSPEKEKTHLKLRY